MKFLMVKQPFANLITLKLKTLESRYWARTCNYRGDILICASKAPMKHYEVRNVMTGQQWNEFEAIRRKLGHDIYEPCGVAQCVVRMTDFRPMNRIEDEKSAFVKWQPGLKVLDFQDIRPVVSFPITGMLGLLNLPAELEKQIRFE